MAKLDELWDPVPRRLIAEMRLEKWAHDRPAPDIVGWLWVFRQIDDGSVPSTRDLCGYAAWGNRKSTRVLNEALEAWKTWSGKVAERQAPHGATKRDTDASPAHHKRDTIATPAHLAESGSADVSAELVEAGATPKHHLSDTDASPERRRARSSFQHDSDTESTRQESAPAATPPGPPSAGAEVSSGGRRSAPSGEAGDETVEMTAGRGPGPVLSKMERPAHGEQLPRITRQFEPFDSIEEMLTPTATAAPSPGVDRPSPPPAPRGTSGEGANGPVQAPLWAQGGAEGQQGAAARGAGSEPAKGPSRVRKPDPPPVDLTSPDDPCLLLLGAKVKIDHLTADIVEVYRAWWRRQPSPATCKLTAGRLQLLRLALETYTAKELCHLIRYAYEADDLGNFARAWRGDAGNLPPDLEMLLRGSNLARNVEMAARWSIEPVSRAPPDEAPNGWHRPLPTPPRGPPRRATTAELMSALNDYAATHL